VPNTHKHCSRSSFIQSEQKRKVQFCANVCFPSSTPFLSNILFSFFLSFFFFYWIFLIFSLPFSLFRPPLTTSTPTLHSLSYTFSSPLVPIRGESALTHTPFLLFPFLPYLPCRAQLLPKPPPNVSA
jgi:hypothetical protein